MMADYEGSSPIDTKSSGYEGSAPLSATPQPAPGKQPSTSIDVIKSLGSGLAQDVLAPFDLAAKAGSYLGNKAAGVIRPNTPDVKVKTPSEMLGVNYEPKTTAGNITQLTAEVAPILVGGGAGAVKKVGDMLEKLAGNLVTKDNASLLNTARKFGIPVFRSQVSKSQPTKMAGSLMKDIPFSGTEGKITDQVEKFNDAVMRTMGGKGSVTPENLGKAYDRISNTYKELTGKYNIKVSQELDNKLLDLSGKAQVQLAGDPAKLKAFHDYWDLVIDNMKSGEIDGKTYQRIRSGIGSTLRGENSSPELGELQTLIDDHFSSAMTPKDAERFQQARQQYRNMIAVEKVLKAGDKGQGISPARLQGAVRQVFGDYAYGGNSDLEELARLGTILKDTFPQSGTAPRAAAMDLAKKVAGTLGVGAAGAGTVGLPATIGGLGGGMAAGRYVLTPYLYQDITQAPSAIEAIRNANIMP